MTDYDAFHERGRSLEEEYFRKKNKELVEKMQLEARDEEARREMGAQIGLDDPEALRELQKLGFTAETVVLLPLVPVVQVAWADGEVADAERSAIFKLARARGIAEGTAAHHRLSSWLTDRPSAAVFTGATRLIRAVLDAPAGEHMHLSADELVKYCESIAAAAGGLFGLNKISSEERAMLSDIAGQLKRNPKSP
jgi:hypothetical protein